MRAFRLVARLLALGVLLALSACGSASPSAARQAPTPAPTAGAGTPAASAPGTANPARLVIPAIGVNALVETVGILVNGDLATPTHNQWEDVGWYDAGPHPGERGSAAIDGHLDRPGGLPAVFWRLRKLHVGDVVQVIDSAGQTLVFHVTRIAFYQPQDAPIQDIFGNRGGTYLNLITCAGDWIPSQQQTTLRLVVYTALG